MSEAAIANTEKALRDLLAVEFQDLLDQELTPEMQEQMEARIMKLQPVLELIKHAPFEIPFSFSLETSDEHSDS